MKTSTVLVFSSAVGLGFGIAIERWQESAARPHLAPSEQDSTDTSPPPLESRSQKPDDQPLNLSLTFNAALTAANTCDSAGNPIGFGRVMIQWLEQASVDELQALFELEKRKAIQQRDRDEANENLTWGMGHGTLELALARWAELDHDSAIAWALAQESVSEYENRMPDMLKGHIPWLKKSPEEALASIAGAKPTVTDRALPQAKKFLAGRSSNIDFDHALECGVDPTSYLMMWSRGGTTIATIASAALNARALTDADLEDVLQFLIPGAPIERTDGLSTREALQTAIAIARSSSCNTLLNVRLADAFGASFGIFAPGPGRGGELRSLFDYDPQGTIRLLNETENPETRRTLIRHIFGANSRNYATRERLDLFFALPAEERPEISHMESFISTASGKLPRATLRWIERVLSENTDKSAVRTLTRLAESTSTYLATQSSEAALQTVRALDDGAFRIALTTGAIQGMVTHDLENALLLSRELTGEARTKADAIVMQEFAKTGGADATIALLEEVTDPDRRRTIVLAIASRSSFQSHGIPPLDAVEIFETFLGDDKSASASATGLVHGWAQLAPAEAAEWMINSDTLPNHASMLIRLWRNLDLDAATEFARNLPPGPVYNDGAETIIDLALQSDPHTALEWSASLSHPKQRLQRLKESVASIQRYATEPNEAEQAILILPIPESERTVLLEHLATPEAHFE